MGELAPATVMPAVGLCSAPLIATADGNFEPLFCSRGALNVAAWRKYTELGPHILGAGGYPSFSAPRPCY
jgi:hypothetical protein